MDTFQAGTLIGGRRGADGFKYHFEHFGGRFKPWRVCPDKAMRERLPAIAAQHRKHWPPTKLENFVLYCKLLNTTGLELLREESTKPNKNRTRGKGARMRTPLKPLAGRETAGLLKRSDLPNIANPVFSGLRTPQATLFGLAQAQA